MNQPRVHVVVERGAPGRGVSSRRVEVSPLRLGPPGEVAPHRRPVESRNAIIEWLRATGRPAGELLSWLMDVDRTMGQTLGSLYALERPADRLAATLLYEFAAGKGLSAGEVAMLLPDSASHARAAIVWLGMRRRVAS